MKQFLSDWYYLSIRNTKQIWRPWLAMLPSFFIPLFFFTVNAASFSAVSKIPGFPADSYFTFIAPTAIFTAAFFPAQNIGIELTLDIVSGYFKKLMIMPIHRLAIILARLSEAAFQAVFIGGIVFLLTLALGARIETGWLGVLAMFLLLIIFSMGWGCVSLIFALLTQNPRLVSSMFMFAFPLLYITSSQMPLELLPAGFRTAALYNPFTYVLEAVRGLMMRGWGDPAIVQGFVVSIILFVVMVTATLMSFQKTIK